MSVRTLRPLVVAIAMATAANIWAQPPHVSPKVEVIDKQFDTAGSMLAYTEFELSGEPLAEALGLDLDVLDPARLNEPTAFDYATGIESYEYSEEAMYAVNYQSRLGPHLVHGPVNARRGGNLEALGKRFVELAGSVGFPAEELPLNLYPISFPYRAAVPEFGQPVDVTAVSRDEVTMKTADGTEKKVAVTVPAYLRDYASLAWREDGMDKSFSPAAAGAQMLKDMMWSQDFLGGMHVIDSDEEVEAQSATQDQDGKHALGVSAADGVNGVMLVEITWDKLTLLRDRLAFDGKQLGATLSPQYDPAKGAVWFAHQVAVTEASGQGVKKIAGLKVVDSRSTLRDTWLLLWPLAEAYAFMDHRVTNGDQNPAFRAVFDGAPFPAAPKANLDLELENDVTADDPFSLASTLTNALFRNLDALHFDAKAGTLVDDWNGKRGTTVTTYDAAYVLAALQIFQRSQDALPVGYASADAGESLATARGQRALVLIKAQADFIVNQLISSDGLAADQYVIGKGPSASRSLATQFAVVRGLAAAFKATGDVRYKKAARDVFLALDKQRFDSATGTWAEQPGNPIEMTPWTAGAISGGMRELLLTLNAQEGEKLPELEPVHLTSRYLAWFRGVVNGARIGEGMQCAEWLADSGEFIVSGDKTGDIDGDHVPQVTHAGGAHGTAMVMAGRVRVSVGR